MALKCPIPDCDGERIRSHIMCYEHWKATPETLRRAVVDAHKECQGSERHMAAVKKAIQWHIDGKAK